MKTAKYLKNILPILFIFSVIFIFIFPFFWENAILYAGDFSGSDLTELNLPLRFASAKAILSGQLPLWNHNLANGFALLAEGQAGVFYPLNFIYLFLPFAFAVNLGFLLNFFLTAVFTYLYSRALEVSRLASIFSALAFAFSGFFIFHLKHLNMINAAVWLPLIFYLIEKYFQTKNNKKYLLFLPLVFAVQFFAGHPQISYISAFSGFVYFVLRFIFSAEDIKKVSISDWLIKVFLVWFFIGVFALGLVAVQFFPTLELSSLSDRNSWIDYESSTVNIFPPRQLLTLFNPYLYGNPALDVFDPKYSYLDVFWENSCYFGLLSAILAFLALICLFKTDKRIKLFAIFILILLFFIFGRYNFLFIYAWLIIPGLKVFRFSQRFLLPFLLIFSILAGFGFDLINKLVKIFFEKYLKPKTIKLILIILPACFMVFLLVDIFYYSNQYISAMPAKYFNITPAGAWLLDQDRLESFRYLSVNWQDAWVSVVKGSGGWQKTENIFLAGNLIPPNLNVFSDLSTSDDRPWQEGGQLFSPLAKIWLLANEKKQPDKEKKYLILDNDYLKIYGMQGVKYFLSFFDLSNENLKEVKRFSQSPLPDLKIYENAFFLPKAFIAYDYLVEKNRKKSLEKIESGFYDFSQEVMVDSAPDFSPAEKDDLISGGVEIVYWQNNRVEIKTQSEKRGLLFLSLTNYPGWQAKVNDKPTKIIGANHAFSAIEIPSGQSRVVLDYKPKSFYLGLFITAIFLLLSLIFMMIYFIKRKKYE